MDFVGPSSRKIGVGLMRMFKSGHDAAKVYQKTNEGINLRKYREDNADVVAVIEMESSRPTVTRALIGAAVAGPVGAIVGLAAQKNETKTGKVRAR
jgi:hypothetical protein